MAHQIWKLHFIHVFLCRPVSDASVFRETAIHRMSNSLAGSYFDLLAPTKWKTASSILAIDWIFDTFFCSWGQGSSQTLHTSHKHVTLGSTSVNPFVVQQEQVKSWLFCFFLSESFQALWAPPLIGHTLWCFWVGLALCFFHLFFVVSVLEPPEADLFLNWRSGSLTGQIYKLCPFRIRLLQSA